VNNGSKLTASVFLIVLLGAMLAAVVSWDAPKIKKDWMRLGREKTVTDKVEAKKPLTEEEKELLKERKYQDARMRGYRYLVMKGKESEGKRLLEWVRDETGDPEIDRVLAGDALRRGKPEEAEPYFERMVEKGVNLQYISDGLVMRCDKRKQGFIEGVRDFIKENKKSGRTKTLLEAYEKKPLRSLDDKTRVLLTGLQIAEGKLTSLPKSLGDRPSYYLRSPILRKYVTEKDGKLRLDATKFKEALTGEKAPADEPESIIEVDA
jgi:hypothetical protein